MEGYQTSKRLELGYPTIETSHGRVFRQDSYQNFFNEGQNEYVVLKKSRDRHVLWASSGFNSES